MDMQYFWYTENTLDRMGLEGLGSPLFGPQHLLELAGALLLCLAAALVYRRLSSRGRRGMCWVVCCLILADELFKQVGALATGQWGVNYLPLHLCSINIFLILAQQLRPSALKQELLYCLCLPGALIALITPTWLDQPTLNFMRIHSLSIHTLLLMYPVMLLSGGFRPDVRRLPRCFAVLIGICIPIYAVNKLFTHLDLGSSAVHAGTNFLFLNYPEPGTPMELFGRWFGTEYGFLLGMPILLALIWALMYLPFLLLERRRRKTAPTAPA